MPPTRADGVDLSALLDDLVRAETRLYNAVDDRLKSELGMSLGRYDLLRCIAARDRCRVHDIANEIAITIGAASKAVDRIESDGLCARTTNPLDHRSSHLTLTAAGRRLLARAHPRVADELGRRLDGVVPAARLRGLASTLTAVRSALEQDPTTGGVGRQRR